MGSLEKLYHDGATLHPDKDPVKFVVTELKGDWKWQQDSWFCLIRNKSSIFCRLPIWVKKKYQKNIMFFHEGFIKRLQEWLQLSCNYLCNAVCHCCRARVPTYFTAPANLGDKFRHNTRTFFEECVKPGLQRHLTYTYFFSGVWGSHPKPKSRNSSYNPKGDIISKIE